MTLLTDGIKPSQSWSAGWACADIKHIFLTRSFNVRSSESTHEGAFKKSLKGWNLNGKRQVHISYWSQWIRQNWRHQLQIEVFRCQRNRNLFQVLALDGSAILRTTSVLTKTAGQARDVAVSKISRKSKSPACRRIEFRSSNPLTMAIWETELNRLNKETFHLRSMRSAGSNTTTRNDSSARIRPTRVSVSCVSTTHDETSQSCVWRVRWSYSLLDVVTLAWTRITAESIRRKPYHWRCSFRKGR